MQWVDSAGLLRPLRAYQQKILLFSIKPLREECPQSEYHRGHFLFSSSGKTVLRRMGLVTDCFASFPLRRLKLV